MKKEYLVLAALILLLSAYLLFHKDDNDHNTLPDIPRLTPDKITGLEILKKDLKIELFKKDGHWLIKGKNHPADSVAVDNMLDALKELKLSALVSQQSDLKRYELDDNKKIRVKVLETGKSVFEFVLGKTAPTFNHTFIMLENNTGIYHASGSFRTYFDQTPEDLRDKKVLGFKEKSIKKIKLTKNGKSNVFTATEEGSDKETGIVWQAEDRSAVDKDAIASLLSALSFLECERYLDDGEKEKLKKEKAFCTIELENDKHLSLTLVKVQTDASDNLAGYSSMSNDAFMLSTFNGNDITGNVDTLLGLKKEDIQKEN